MNNNISESFIQNLVMAIDRLVVIDSFDTNLQIKENDFESLKLESYSYQKTI